MFSDKAILLAGVFALCGASKKFEQDVSKVC